MFSLTVLVSNIMHACINFTVYNYTASNYSTTVTTIKSSTISDIPPVYTVHTTVVPAFTATPAADSPGNVTSITKIYMYPNFLNLFHSLCYSTSSDSSHYFCSGSSFAVYNNSRVQLSSQKTICNQ